MSGNKKPNIISATEIATTQYPKIKWAIKNLLPEGLTILGGNPKLGKSWMVLNLGLIIASGKEINPAFKFDVTQGVVLYIALEDNERRLHYRLKKCCRKRNIPSNLHFSTEWPIIGQGGLRAIKDFIKQVPETSLIIIDPIAKVWPRSTSGRKDPNRTIYHNDYDIISSIKKISDKHNVSILCNHHLTKNQKGDDPLGLLSGSMAISGGIDTVMVARRTRSASSGTLFITGRDIYEKTEEIEFNKKTGWWKFLGDRKPLLTVATLELLEVLKTHAIPIKLSSIVKITNKSPQNINKMLKVLVENGNVEKVGIGIYKACEDEDMDFEEE